MAADRNRIELAKYLLEKKEIDPNKGVRF